MSTRQFYSSGEFAEKFSTIKRIREIPNIINNKTQIEFKRTAGDGRNK